MRHREYSGSPIGTYCTYDVDLSKIVQDTDSSKTLQSSGFSSINPEQNIVQTQQFSSTTYKDISPDFYVDGNNKDFGISFAFGYNNSIVPLQFNDVVFGNIILMPSFEITGYAVKDIKENILSEKLGLNLKVPCKTDIIPITEFCDTSSNFAERPVKYIVTVKDLSTSNTYDFVWERTLVNVLHEPQDITMLVFDKNSGVNGSFIEPYLNTMITKSSLNPNVLNKNNQDTIISTPLVSNLRVFELCFDMTSEIRIYFKDIKLNDKLKQYIMNNITLYVLYDNKKIQCVKHGFNGDQLVFSILAEDYQILSTGDQSFRLEFEYSNVFSGLYTSITTKSSLLAIDSIKPEIIITKKSAVNLTSYEISDNTFGNTMEKVDASGYPSNNYTSEITGTGIVQKTHFIAEIKDNLLVSKDINTKEYIHQHLQLYINNQLVFANGTLVPNSVNFQGTILVQPLNGFVSLINRSLWEITVQYDGKLLNFFDSRIITMQLLDIIDMAKNKAKQVERLLYTPATKFIVDYDLNSSLLAEELTISELTYMKDSSTQYQMRISLNPDKIRCNAYKIVLKINNIDVNLDNYMAGKAGTEFLANVDVELINLPVDASSITLQFTTVNQNGFTTVGDSLAINSTAISGALGKAIDLAPDFTAQKEVYLNWPQSPLYTSKSIYIPKGCTLHIGGYTRILFVLPISNEGLLVEDEKKIIVDGTLIIDGQSDNGTGKYPYISGTDMNGSSSVPAYFGGIYILKGGNIYLQNIAISYASAALFFEDTNSMAIVTATTASQFKTDYANTTDDITSVYINSITMSQCKIAVLFYKTSNDSVYETAYSAKVKAVVEQLFVTASAASQPAIKLLDTAKTAELKIVAVVSQALKEWYQTLKTDITSLLYPVISPYFVFSDQL